jgi:tetratricopeptide (TPR) repeat protein
MSAADRHREAMLATARSLIENREYAAALRVLLALKRPDDDDAELATLLARCRELQERAEELEERKRRARMAMDRGDFTAAEQAWQHVLELAHGDAEALDALSRIRNLLETERQSAERLHEIRKAYARRDYDRVIELIKEFPADQAAPDELDQLYAEVLRLRSHRESARRLLRTARTQMEAGEFAEALATWTQAHELDPDDQEIRAGMDEARAAMARRQLEDLRDRMIQRIRRLVGEGNLAAAQELCSSCQEIWPGDVTVRQVCSDVEAALGATREAEALREQGQALYDAGRYEEAARRWELSLELNPEQDELGRLIQSAWLLAEREHPPGADHGADSRPS